jgi:hypothetical protein
MGKASSEEKQSWHDRGETDAAAGHASNPLAGPWRGALESSDHYDDCNQAWNSGVANNQAQRSK